MRANFFWCGIVCVLVAPAGARAFCGFYVGSADSELSNGATMVVMMREGTKTVLSMQNDYRGPAEDFAMVVPVPVVLSADNVRTLPRDVFERVDHLAAPRLVEYWEQDPCPEFGEGTIGLGALGTLGHGAGGGGSGYGRGAGPPLVTVEAEFAVGEYDIVILGARDSSALDAWLRDHRYSIPDGAGEVLRPYVEEGMKFFVAKVNADRVTFRNGRAVLSPLRVWYDDETFRLPVRLGLLNSPGTQDLVVHVLALSQRYEVANYPNATIPTNLDVTDEVRERFGEFYAALFDRTIEQNRGAVVTEYAWQATGCDPCPGPVLSEQDLLTLGADVALTPAQRQPRASRITTGAVRVEGSLSPDIVRRVFRRNINQARFCYDTALARDPSVSGEVTLRAVVGVDGSVVEAGEERSTVASPQLRSCLQQMVRRLRFPGDDDERMVIHVPLVLANDGPRIRYVGTPAPYQSFVLTRLHYRYEENGLGQDLVFRAAEPIVGGREIPDATGALEKGATPAPANNFQGRYAIRHPWEGEIDCESPMRGVWGGPPSDAPPGASETKAATDTAMAPRGRVDLRSMLKQDLPALGVVAPAAAAAQVEAAPAQPPPAARSDGGGCACSATSADAAATLLPLGLVFGLGASRRRRR